MNLTSVPLILSVVLLLVGTYFWEFWLCRIFENYPVFYADLSIKKGEKNLHKADGKREIKYIFISILFLFLQERWNGKKMCWDIIGIIFSFISLLSFLSILVFFFTFYSSQFSSVIFFAYLSMRWNTLSRVRIVLYCIVLYWVVLYCIILYSIGLDCIVLYFIELNWIELYCIVLYCIVLYFIVLYCIVLYCIVLYCIVLYCIVLYWVVLYWIV